MPFWSNATSLDGSPSFRLRATTPTRLSAPRATTPSFCPSLAAVSCHRFSYAASLRGIPPKDACRGPAVQQGCQGFWEGRAAV